MVAATHWRVFVDDFNPESVFWGINELEMASEEGGTNLCTGGTPSASNFHSSWQPSRAFNGSKATSDGWLTSSSNGNQAFRVNQWLAYQFQNPVDIQEIRITSCDTGLTGTRGAYPVNFHLERSDDGSNWIRVASYSETGSDWRDLEQRVYPASDIRSEIVPFTATYNNPRESSYQGDLDDNIRSSQTNSHYAGWQSVDGDMVTCTLDSPGLVAFARVYFINGTGNAGVNRPTTLYAKANGQSFQAEMDGSKDVWVSLGHSNWGDVVYVDIPINQTTGEVVIGFTGASWQMLVEIDLYDDPVSYTVSGKATRGNNIPYGATVYVHSQSNGALLTSGNSDPVTGEFELSVSEGSPVFVRVVDPEGLYNSVLRENLIPVQVDPV